MKINIGSGYKRYPDFINVDADPNCKPDHIVDLETGALPFPDSSVDTVIAHHILEHMGEGYFHLLKELYRVCKHGAVIDIRVPHPNHEVFLNDPTHKRPIMVDGLRLFSKQFNKLEIQRGGASSTLGIMHDVDFEIINYEFIHDPYYDEIKKTLSHPQLERLFREALNVCIEIHVQLMVIKDV